MSAVINPNLYPKSGYRFKDRDGTLIVGTSWVHVMKKVENYRKRAGLPPGNAEAEVMASACRDNPGYCSEVSEATIRQRAVVSLKGRVLQFLNIVRRQIEKGIPFPMVERNEAGKRADICAKCPANAGLPEGCASCRATLNANRKAIIGGRTIDSRLNGCLHTGEDLPTSIWLDQQTAELPAAPANCWRKRTL